MIPNSPKHSQEYRVDDEAKDVIQSRLWRMNNAADIMQATLGAMLEVATVQAPKPTVHEASATAINLASRQTIQDEQALRVAEAQQRVAEAHGDAA